LFDNFADKATFGRAFLRFVWCLTAHKPGAMLAAVTIFSLISRMLFIKQHWGKRGAIPPLSRNGKGPRPKSEYPTLILARAVPSWKKEKRALNPISPVILPPPLGGFSFHGQSLPPVTVRRTFPRSQILTLFVQF
jgi:hypothetical protein